MADFTFTRKAFTTYASCDKVTYEINKVNNLTGVPAQVPAGGYPSAGNANQIGNVLFSDAECTDLVALIEYDDSSQKCYVTGFINGVFTATPLGQNESITVSSTPRTTQVNINNGNNLKKVTVGDTEYTDFPVSVSVSGGTTITGYGKDSPVITVDYLNTQEPVITDS